MKTKLLPVIFLFALCMECFAVYTNNFSLQLFTKPALMPLLMFYFFIETRTAVSLKTLIFGALFFSWVGDVVLLFDKYFGGLFVFGLLAFLAAHLFYIYYFWQTGKLNSAARKLKMPVVIGVLLYSGTLYFLLFPFLDAMKIPVSVYSVIISLMLLTSFHAFDSFGKNFAKLCLAGTLLFVVSDSILAVNRFAFPFTSAPVLIMLTYGLAQLLITEGSLRNLREITE